MNIEERKDILREEINRLMKKGYVLISQTDTAAQLEKPKQFSFFLAFIFLLLAIIPLILYLLVFAFGKPETIYIEVLESGKINKKIRR